MLSYLEKDALHTVRHADNKYELQEGSRSTEKTVWKYTENQIYVHEWVAEVEVNHFRSWRESYALVLQWYRESY